MVVQLSFVRVALSQPKEASSGWLMLGEVISGLVPASITPWRIPEDEANLDYGYGSYDAAYFGMTP